jgi:hypothetical protein
MDMTDEPQTLTAEQLKRLFDQILPPDEEMDHDTAILFLERAGVDRVAFSKRLKSRLERRANELRSSGKSVPPDLLNVIAVL